MGWHPTEGTRSSQPASEVEGQLLGLLQEPMVAGETPKVVQLPEQLLELFEVTVPTEDEFAEKLVSRIASNKEDNGKGTITNNGNAIPSISCVRRLHG